MKDSEKSSGQRLFDAEKKKIVGSFTAFSMAILILFIQGNISVDAVPGVIGLFLIAASVPPGVFSYLVSIKILDSPGEEVPDKAIQKSETFFIAAMALSGGGFAALLYEFSPPLFFVMALSFLCAAFFFNRIIDLWPSSDASDIGVVDCDDEQIKALKGENVPVQSKGLNTDK